MLTTEQRNLWGESHGWSTAIAGESAAILKIPGYRADGDPTAALCAEEFLREVAASPPTRRRFYHGGPGRTDYVVGKVVRLPLTALSDDKHHARSFTSGDRAELLTFERGVRAMRYSPIEWITAGAFRVASVKAGKDAPW